VLFVWVCEVRLPLVAADVVPPLLSLALVVALFMYDLIGPLAEDFCQLHRSRHAWLSQAGAANFHAADSNVVVAKDEQGTSTRMCRLFQFAACLQEGVHHSPEAQPSGEVALDGCLVACASNHQASRGRGFLPPSGVHTNDNARA
jgi:hypothetical protein